jgi:hypothetical protein
MRVWGQILRGEEPRLMTVGQRDQVQRLSRGSNNKNQNTVGLLQTSFSEITHIQKENLIWTQNNLTFFHQPSISQKFDVALLRIKTSPSSKQK